MPPSTGSSAEFNEDVAIFETLEQELRAFMTQHRQRIEIAERRAAETQRGRERLEAARERPSPMSPAIAASDACRRCSATSVVRLCRPPPDAAGILRDGGGVRAATSRRSRHRYGCWRHSTHVELGMPVADMPRARPRGLAAILAVPAASAAPRTTPSTRCIACLQQLATSDSVDWSNPNSCRADVTRAAAAPPDHARSSAATPAGLSSRTWPNACARWRSGPGCN